jgi:hypothetical protein
MIEKLIHPVALVLALAISFSGCTAEPPELPEDLPEQEGVVELVSRVISCAPMEVGSQIEYSLDDLNDGWRVEVTFHRHGKQTENASLIYWVFEDGVYWVSNSAAKCSPSIEKAPETVIEGNASGNWNSSDL